MGARRPRSDPLRDHGGFGCRGVRCTGRASALFLRPASRAVDGAVLCRPGIGEGGGFLSSGRRGRTALHQVGNRSIRAPAIGGMRRENAPLEAQDKPTVRRRSFFRLIGTRAAAGAMAPLGREAAADSEKEDEKRKARYRESEEVQTYYRVNRYPQ